jgi:hypothetical protein
VPMPVPLYHLAALPSIPIFIKVSFQNDYILLY